MSLVSFGSDNHAGVHPLLMEEMVKVNHGFAASYEQDSISQELKKIVLQQFDAVDCAMVFNGTAANVLCLQLSLKSYEAALCAHNSHLMIDECGAPEKITGVKLLPLEAAEGKIVIDKVAQHIIRKGDQHHSQARLLSITQPTEHGTVYSFAELEQLKALCEKHNLYFHMDGARLANAAVTLGCSLTDLAQFFDVISFGGAKNGLMLGELVIVRNPTLQEGLRFYRKQSLQLPSKTRFLAAPFLKYLESSLWQEIALHENRLARKLHAKIKEIDNVTITHPTESNAVFCKLPQKVIKKLRKKFFFYVWDENTFEVRLMTSFATSDEDIEDFTMTLKEIIMTKEQT